MNNIKLPDTADDAAYSTLIGVLVSVCGNALISVALNVQKGAHNNIQRKQQYYADIDDQPSWTYNGFLPDDGYSSPRNSFDAHPYSMEQPTQEHQQRRFIMTLENQEQKISDTEFLKSKLWWLGILLMILGEVGNFVAYGFAPASTIAPLGTTTLVANVIIAPLMLKEVFRKRDLLGVILAVSGAATVVLSSNSEEVALSPELIMESITQTRSIIYFVVTAIVIAILTIISPVYGSASIFIDLGLVAVYGGYTVLSTKSVASLLNLTLWKMFTFPMSYILIFVLIFTAILQIKYLNKALQRFESTEVIPTQFVLFTVSAILGSAVLYHDFDDMTINQLSKFTLGCAIEFLGVYLITSKRNKYIDSSFSQAERGAGISLYDNTDEAISHADIVRPDDQSSILSASNPLSINDYKSVSKKTSAQQLLIAANGTHQPHLRNSPSFEIWREPSDNKYHILSNSNSTSNMIGHRRNSSSIFRGISMASQLVDRNEEHISTPAIQLPISVSPSNVSSSYLNTASRKLTDSAFNNLVQSFTSSLSSPPNRISDAVVNLKIPTVSTSTSSASLTNQKNTNHTLPDDEHSLERELMPLDNQNTMVPISATTKLPRSRKLIDIQEDASEEVVED